MSKIIVTADLHAQKGSTNNDRLVDLLEVLKFIHDFAVNSGIFNIFYLGDICHNRNKVDFVLLWYLLRAFHSPQNRERQQVFLPGNHDWVVPNENLHALEALRGIGDVIDQPRRMVVGERVILLVPFCPDRESFRKGLDKAWKQFEKQPKGRKKPFLFIHQGVNGFKVGSDFVLEQDLDYKDLMPERFDLIVSGHYHKHQCDKKLVYCGSPYQLNFGERTNRTGFLVVETEEPTSWNFIEIPGSPKFIRIEKASQVSKNAIEGNFVQVSDESLVEKVRKLQPRRLSFVPPVRKPRIGKRLEVEHTDSLEKVLEAYVGKSGKPGKEGLLRLGMEILEEARGKQD